MKVPMSQEDLEKLVNNAVIFRNHKEHHGMGRHLYADDVFSTRLYLQNGTLTIVAQALIPNGFRGFLWNIGVRHSALPMYDAHGYVISDGVRKDWTEPLDGWETYRLFRSKYERQFERSP